MINYEGSLVILWLLMLMMVIIETIKRKQAYTYVNQFNVLCIITYQWLESKDSGNIKNYQEVRGWMGF